MSTIRAALRSVTIGNKRAFRNLTIFPLILETTARPDYLTLNNVLELGKAQMREISSVGDVDSLKFVNRSPLPVLIVDGEELLGSKQNRVVNITTLAPPNATTNLPVSCVESNRWSAQGGDLHCAGHTHFARGRRARNATVSASLRSSGSPAADQFSIWADIHDKAERMDVHSPSGAMADIFTQHADAANEYVNAFEPLPMQIGIVFAIDNRIEGLELFDSPETLAMMQPQLIRSYAIDAIEKAIEDETAGENHCHANYQAAHAFLENTLLANEEYYPGIGLGNELRVTGSEVVGGGLVWNEKLLHLAAFSMPVNVNDSSITYIKRL